MVLKNLTPTQRGGLLYNMTKEQLEALALQELGIELDKQHTKEQQYDEMCKLVEKEIGKVIWPPVEPPPEPEPEPVPTEVPSNWPFPLVEDEE